MTVKQIILPANRAFNSGGTPVAEATASLYLSGTLTPALFYADSGLSVSLGSTITANAAGRFATLPYGNDTIAYRLILKDSSGATLDDIDPFYFGSSIWGTLTAASGASVSSRDLLAALSNPIANQSATLTESGREGVFVFSTANLSAQVTADTQQGIYVAPSSNTTGASGTWVRKYTGAINPRWFGISDTNSAAANSSAFTALKTALKAAASLSGSYGSLPRVSFPDDKTYNFASTLDIDNGTMILSADVLATPTTGATIKVAATTAIRLQRYNTSGASANTGTGIGGDSSIIERLRIIGGYAGAEGEFHGIHIRAHGVKVRDCYISGFEGDGIYVLADIAPDNGNANCTLISDNIISDNRNGIYFHGGNANAGETHGNDTSNNRQWGIWDSSFLANTHTAGITENSGRCAGSYTPSMVSYSGNQYACVAGQEVGASTNAPSGTTADNTYWYYCQAGGPDTVNFNIPTWVSGTTYRAGGPIRTDNNNAPNIICGYYAEIGQGPMQLVWPTLLLGGAIFSGVRGISYLRHDDTGICVNLSSPNNAFNITDLKGTGSPFWKINSNGANLRESKALTFTDTGVTSNWSMSNGSGNLVISTNDNFGGYFFSAGAQTFNFDSTGINIASGKVLKVNSATILNGTGVLQAAGFPALTGDVTTTAGSLATTLNTVSGALKTSSPTSGMGYATGAGGTVTQITSRTTGVTLNKICGQITLFSAAGSATWSTFTVTNSTVAATDTIEIVQKSGANLYNVIVTAVAAGSFNVSVSAVSGTATEAPVFNFVVTKSVAA